MDELRKKRRRLLLTVDEVTNCESVRVFASSFQIFSQQEYPIFLLMAGLYDNIYDLQNADALTFLYRAPKMVLEPLNYTAIRKRYMDIFDLDLEAAGKMAGLTTKVKKIREAVGMKPEQFSVYRDRLKRKGVLDTSKYGEVSFVLPRFAEFVLMRIF